MIPTSHAWISRTVILRIILETCLAGSNAPPPIASIVHGNGTLPRFSLDFGTGAHLVVFVQE